MSGETWETLRPGRDPESDAEYIAGPVVPPPPKGETDPPRDDIP